MVSRGQLLVMCQLGWPGNPPVAVRLSQPRMKGSSESQRCTYASFTRVGCQELQVGKKKMDVSQLSSSSRLWALCTQLHPKIEVIDGHDTYGVDPRSEPMNHCLEIICLHVMLQPIQQMSKNVMAAGSESHLNGSVCGATTALTQKIRQNQDNFRFAMR